MTNAQVAFNCGVLLCLEYIHRCGGNEDMALTIAENIGIQNLAEAAAKQGQRDFYSDLIAWLYQLKTKNSAQKETQP